MCTAMPGVLGILTCPATSNYALTCAYTSEAMHILSTQNYVYSISKLRVNQLVISKSIYFKMALTWFSSSQQVHVAGHVWFLNLYNIKYIKDSHWICIKCKHVNHKLKGKDHKNTFWFCLNVFVKLNSLKQTAWKSDIYFWRYCDFMRSE